MSVNHFFTTAKNGVRLYCEEYGEGGRTIVMPNGVVSANDFAQLADEFRLIVYDPRSRGLSDLWMEDGVLRGDIHTDVDDLEEIRTQLGIEKLDLVAHSYAGWIAMNYAMKYPSHVGRLVMIGPMPPVADRPYPPELTFDDGTMGRVFAKMGQLRNEATGKSPEELCRANWAEFRTVFVTDPANAGRIDFGRCELENERNFMRYWLGNLLPSIQKLNFTAEDFARVTCPVLIVHGTCDRNTPYGGGRDWAAVLPDGRLVTVEGAAHAPWVEEPEVVFGTIRDFLKTGGKWAESAKSQ